MTEVHAIHSVEELKALKASHKYILIDFWAEWCPPCKAMAPFYANLAKSHGVAHALAFAKVDIEEVPDISKLYGITSLPSFLVLQDGEPQGIDVGSQSLGGGAVLSDGKLTMIRGTDAKNLTLLATKLKELAAAEAS